MDVAPLDRPRRARATVRVLLFDDRDRLLLIHDSDPGLAGATWWMTPGGGIDAGEDELAAVVRELAEETGLHVTPDAAHGPVARQQVVHGYSDKIVDQHDTYYVVRTAPFEPSTAGFTADEQASVLGLRWWTRAELDASDETVRPTALGRLWDAVADPASWPLQLAPVQESSVPV